MKYKITKKIFNEIVEYFNNCDMKIDVKKQHDIYFSPILFPFFGGKIDNECLRIRVLEDKNILSYKKYIPSTDSAPAHSIEYELKVSDIDELKLILSDLRIEEAFTLKKERRSVIYKKNIEISLDIVSDLGYFIELEVINHENIDEALNDIKDFTQKFLITDSMRNYDGYSYLLYNAKNKRLNGE